MKSLKINRINLSFTALVMLLLTAGLFAQSQVPDGDYPNTVDAKGLKQGKWKKLDDKGTCIYVGQFKDDKPNGVFTYFDTDGKKMSEMNFLNGGPTAYGKMFSVAGKLQAEGKYLNQKKDSLWTFYTEDGLLLSQENYKAGKKEGKSLTYHPGTKQVAEIKFYKNDLQDSSDLQYYFDGKKEAELFFRNGNQEGRAVWYFPSGQVNIIGNYVHGLKDGNWVYYWFDESGKYVVKGKETWKNGKLTSQEQIISKEEFQKQIEDPQDPNHNKGGDGNGGQ